MSEAAPVSWTESTARRRGSGTAWRRTHDRRQFWRGLPDLRTVKGDGR
jgi:hypothetical protein